MKQNLEHSLEGMKLRTCLISNNDLKDYTLRLSVPADNKQKYQVIGGKKLYSVDKFKNITLASKLFADDAKNKNTVDEYLELAFAHTGIALKEIYKLIIDIKDFKPQKILDFAEKVTLQLRGKPLSFFQETAPQATPTIQDVDVDTTPALEKFNVVMLVAYNGKNYAGFQRQNDVDTVQGRLEKALSKIANQEITTNCAGRTDAGVHGTNQVINFETTAVRPLHSWLRGTNTELPPDIRVVQVDFAPLEFHARHSAVARRYRYLFQVNPDNLISPHLTGMITNIPYELDLALMNQAAEHLLGEQDFKSFQAANCQSPTSNRFIHHACFYQFGKICVFDIKANAFLYHMVRNIMGALLAVGNKKMTVEQFKELIAARDRTQAPAMAPADGLFLVEVSYPEPYNHLKPREIGPLYLPNMNLFSIDNPRSKTNPYYSELDKPIND